MALWQGDAICRNTATDIFYHANVCITVYVPLKKQFCACAQEIFSFWSCCYGRKMLVFCLPMLFPPLWLNLRWTTFAKTKKVCLGIMLGKQLGHLTVRANLCLVWRKIKIEAYAKPFHTSTPIYDDVNTLFISQTLVLLRNVLYFPALCKNVAPFCLLILVCNCR